MGPPSGNGELVLALFPYLTPPLPPLSRPSSRGCVDDCCIVWNLVGNLLDESFTDPSDLLTPNYGVIYNRKVAARHSGNK